MSNVEKEYQKRFFGKQESNSDFDTEGLWSAIQTEVQPKNKYRKYVLWFCLTILAIGVGAIICNHLNTSTSNIQNAITLPESNSDNTNIVEAKESNYIDQKHEATIALNETKETNRRNTTKAPIAVKNEESSDAKLQTTIPPLSSESNLTNIADANQILEKTNHINAARQSKKSKYPQTVTDALDNRIANPSLPIKKYNQEPANPIQETNKDDARTHSAEFERISIDPIYTIVNSYLANNRTTIDHKPTAIDINPDMDYNGDQDPNEDTPRNITIDMYGGINYNNHNYTSENMAVDVLKNESESSFVGNTFGMAISKPIYNNIHSSIGIEYNNLWTMTKINLSIDSTKFLQDEIVKIIIDPQTQDTIETFRDSITVNALYTRELVHHNNVKTISFPLSIGYHYKMNRIDLGINVGVVYSLRILQSGKKYNNQGKIFEYNNDSSTLPFKKSSISFRLSPVIRYKLNDSYSLSFLPQYQFSNGNHSSDSSVSTSSSVWNFNIGIGKYF